MQDTSIQMIILIFFIILRILSFWMINQKANIPGYYALIPIYNEYIIFKIANCSKKFVNMILCTVLSMIGFTISIIYLFFQMFVYLPEVDINTITFNEGASYEYQILYRIMYNHHYRFIIALIAILSIILLILALRAFYAKCKGLTACFLAPPLFSWGLFFFEPIFLLILAFNSKYHYFKETDETIDHQYFE